MELKKVDVSFANQLVDLWVSTFYQAYSDKHTMENMKSYTDRVYTLGAAKDVLRSDVQDCIVAFEDEKEVGFYLNKYCPCPVMDKDEKSVELKQIYILPDQFGTGLGKTLLEHAYETARKADAKNIWLVVVDINERARLFYLKQGFVEIGEGPILEIGSDHLTSKYMMRRL